MSTRYVWDKRSIKDIYGLSQPTTTTKYTYTMESHSYAVGAEGNYYEIRNGKFNVYYNSDFSEIRSLSITNDWPETNSYASLYFQYAQPFTDGTYSASDVMLSKPINLSEDYAVYFTRSGNTISAVCTNFDSGDYTKPNKPFNVYRAVVESQEAGDFIGNVSSSNSNTYSKDGINGDNWYVYKGSDNIDPTAIRYSVDDLYSGEPFEISVTPRTPTYGGTVYYRYQYSTDGGSTWANIGSRTTATSATVTIPEGAERFQARVLASDGWGFTSSTYVYGPAKEVSQLKAYVGIGGKSSSLKKGYVGVGGKAMQLVKGYVGVGGVAKKLF